MNIPFCVPYISDEEVEAASNVIRSGWITSAKKGEEFEEAFSNYVGSKYAIFLNSCTSALYLSVEWYKKKYNIKKVLVPSLTFVASVQAIVHAGLEPVFGDVGKDYLLRDNLNFGYDNYDAVMPVHIYGNKADTNWGVPTIEDSAHLVEKDQCRGKSNIVCFSFYATKNLSVGEGGMIATNDEEFYNWAKQARHHGISKSGWDRYQPGRKWRYDVEFMGWKFNQSDIMAAIGIEQLKKFDKIQEERKRCVDLYNRILSYKNEGLHLYPILVNEREKFIEKMEKVGISCSVHFLPVHKMTAFKDYNNLDLPNTNYFGEHLVSLPLFPALKDEEIKYICQKVLETGLLI